MKNESGNEYLTKIKRSVPRKVRGKLEQAYNTADESKKVKVNNLHLSKLHFDVVLNGWVSIFATLLGGLMLLVNIIMFAVVYPHKGSVAQGAYEIYAKTDELYNYSLNTGKIENTEATTFEAFDELFITNDTGCKQAIEDLNKATSECEEALGKYTEKLNEYQANLKYVNDRINNYEKYLIDHKQENAEGNADKIQEYEKKRDGLDGLKAQCDELANNYYAKLTDKTNKKEALNAKALARYEYYPLEYKVKMLNLYSNKGGVYNDYLSSLNELKAQHTRFNEAADARIGLYNSDRDTEKSIAAKEEESEAYRAIYDAFMAAPVNYLTVDSVEIYSRYAVAQKEYDRLAKAYEEALDSNKDTAKEELDAYTQSVYSPLKTKYDRNEKILGYFKLNGYASICAKDNKSKDDTEKLQGYEELVNTYVQVKSWQVADYDAAAVAADANDKTAKHNKKAYEGWFGGICSAENMFYDLSADTTQLNERLKTNVYDEVNAKGEMVTSYYIMENACIWLKLRSNDLTVLADNVVKAYTDMGNKLQMGYLTAEDRQTILADIEYSGAADSINGWVQSRTDYDLSVDSFKPFDYNGYPVEVDAEGAVQIPNGQLLSGQISDMEEEFNNTLVGYEGAMGSIHTVSDLAFSYAKTTNESAEFIRIAMIPYNSVVMAVLLAYFAGLLIVGTVEAKHHNYEAINSVLKEDE